MGYTNKAAHLLFGGEHITSCAILYHAEGEWMSRRGESMPMLKPGKALYDGHLCYDIICLDILKKADVKDGKLAVNGETYGALVIPYAPGLPDALIAEVDKLIAAGVPVLLCEGRPKGVSGEVVSLTDLPVRIRELGLGDITLDEDAPLLRHYHMKREGTEVFMFFNENSVSAAKTTVTLPVSGSFARLRLLEDGVYRDATPDGCVEINLLPGQSEILVFGKELEGVEYENLQALSTPVRETVLTPAYTLELADSEDLTAFYPYKTTDELFNVTGATEKPDFSGLMRYTFTLNLEDVPAECALDLGRVGQTAKVTVNGTEIGIRLTAPYTYPVSGLLRKGENTVTVEVANTLVGKVRDYFSFFMPIHPSGLLGPVKLVEY